MLRRTLFALTMVAGMSLATPPQAQGSIDLSSSMSAQCLGGTCQNVSFFLNVAGNVFVDAVRIFSTNATLWTFGSVLQVLDSGGNDVTGSWTPLISNNAITLQNFATGGPGLFAEPLRFIVQMSTYSTEANLYGGQLTYSANGDLYYPSTNTLFSTSGTVTPEPSTFLLLGTGLIGLFGMARKRREDGSEEDVAA